MDEMLQRLILSIGQQAEMPARTLGSAAPSYLTQGQKQSGWRIWAKIWGVGFAFAIYPGCSTKRLWRGWMRPSPTGATNLRTSQYIAIRGVDNISLQCVASYANSRASGTIPEDRGADTRSLTSHVENLMVLELGDCHLTTDGIDALAASPYFRCLTTLKLNASRLGAQGVEALSRASYLEQLTTLEAQAKRTLDLKAQERWRVYRTKNYKNLLTTATVAANTSDWRRRAAACCRLSALGQTQDAPPRR